MLRHFYGTVLGMTEVPKPPALAARGGAWFRCGTLELHPGIEDDFRPARKAHPALRVRGLAALVERAGLDFTRSDELPGVRRGHVDDPFGNRLELIEAGSDETGTDEDRS